MVLEPGQMACTAAAFQLSSDILFSEKWKKKKKKKFSGFSFLKESSLIHNFFDSKLTQKL